MKIFMTMMRLKGSMISLNRKEYIRVLLQLESLVEEVLFHLSLHFRIIAVTQVPKILALNSRRTLKNSKLRDHLA